MLIALSGAAGSGKDLVADYLVAQRGFAKIAFADPIKRFAREVYGFSEVQLWGPSAMRNAPDVRYLRETHERHSWVENTFARSEAERWSCDRCSFTQGELQGHNLEKRGHECRVYLTPRLALQLMGSEVGRKCYENTWVDLGLRTARTLLGGGPWRYSGPRGLYQTPEIQGSVPGVVVTDCRFRNEIDAFRKEGGRILRIERPTAGLSGSAASHQSERDLDGVPESTFDGLLANNSTIAALYEQVDSLFSSFEANIA